MSYSPLVSIILPTYNRGYCIGRAIESILNQTYSDWELIIVDNHSTDETDMVVGNFVDPRIRLVKVHNHGVIARSRNRGIDEANGPLIAFLDSDDWWSPQKLTLSVSAMDAGADLVFHDLYIISTLPPIARCWRRVKTWQVCKPAYLNLLRHGNAISNSSVVVRSCWLKKIGGFSEDPLLATSEDFDGWLRLAQHTDAFVRLKLPLGFYWAGGGNESGSRHTIKAGLRFQEKYATDLLQYCGSKTPYWLSYTLSRAYFLEKDNKKTIYFAWRCISWRAPLLITIKGLFTLIYALFRIATSKSGAV